MRMCWSVVGSASGVDCALLLASFVALVFLALVLALGRDLFAVVSGRCVCVCARVVCCAGRLLALGSLALAGF